MFAQTVIRALSRLGLDQRGSDPHPRQPAPMLLQKADAMFASADWTYEPKCDGFRVLATVRDGSVRLISRNGHSFTNLFWPISDALRGFPTPILLDGEVIAINDKGQPDFEALVTAVSSLPPFPRSTGPVAPGRAPIRHGRSGRARGIRVPCVRGTRRSSLRGLHRLGGGANNMENKSCVVSFQDGAKRQVWAGSQRDRQRTGFLVSAARRGICVISF